jgi:HAD superfamily hydrolase (TIGR01549 family)
VTQAEPSAIIFDIDGTLIDSTYHHALAWRRAFAAQHVSVPLWRVHRAIGMGGDRLVAEVAGTEVEDRCGDRLREAWRSEYIGLKSEVEPLESAAALVRTLAESGHRVALASSGDPEFADEALDDLGIRDHVAVLTTSQDADSSKPDPDLIERTLDRLGVRRAVVVGDTPYDVASAERAGLRCIGLRSGGYGEAELTDAGAVLVVDGPADLIDLDWEQYLDGGMA